MKGLPLDAPRPGRYALSRNLIRDQEVCDHLYRGPSCVLNFDGSSKIEVRHPVREWTIETSHKKVLLVRREVSRENHRRLADVLDETCLRVYNGELRVGEILKEVLVMSRFQQILKCCRSRHFAGGLFDIRSWRNSRNIRRFSIAVGHNAHEETHVIAQPLKRRAEHIIHSERSDCLRLAGCRFGYPELNSSLNIPRERNLRSVV